MRPLVALDDDALRYNARTFAALGSPVVAVLKNDGYNWGAARMVRALDDVVAGYVVNDIDEFDAIRAHTALPVRTLSELPAARIADVIASGGIPNIASLETLAAADAACRARGGAARIRVGICDASGWSVPSRAVWPAFVAAAARAEVAIELWTHLTSAARGARQAADLGAARDALLAAGATVVSTDLASTASATSAHAGDRQRIGVGLFGAALGAPVQLRCAVRLEAPVVRRYAPGEIGWAGYGDVPVPPNRSVTVLRCGYGDGYPNMLAGADDILAVGMQFTTLASSGDPSSCVLIGPDTKLDDLARQASITPHQLVVGIAIRQ